MTESWILHPGLPLLAAHVLVDFVVQSNRDVEQKTRLRPGAFVRHALQHAAVAWVFVGAWTAWWIPLAVFGAHGAIDVVKELVRSRLRTSGRLDAPSNLRLFATDQIAHVLSLAAIAVWLGPRTPAPPWPATIPVDAVFVVLIGLVVCVRTGSIVIALAVRRFEGSLRQAHDDTTDAPDRALGIEPRGLSGGGQMIGALERALIFFFVLIGRVDGVGFLLAAKSILRFGDLNARQQRVEAEYVIIGTFMSFAWALFVAWLTTRALASVG